MKKIFLFAVFTIPFYLISLAQTDTAFKKKWQQIDTLILKKDLPKTALAKVNEIYAEAKTANNSAQVIKALLYRLSLEEQVTEQDVNTNIAAVEKEIQSTESEAAKSILQTVLANMYAAYINNNGWRIYNRTATENFKKDDVTTWSANDFDDTITALYKQALQPEKVLLQTDLQTFSPLVIKGNAENLRPTLYDLIAHQALEYFKSSNHFITTPSGNYEISDSAVLASFDVFINHDFNSGDSASHLLNALRLFQKLLSFHRNDKDPSAFIDVDIDRIQWVYESSIIQNKESIYKRALEAVTNIFPDNNVSAEAWYLIAKIYADKAATYDPLGDTTHRYDYVKAKQLLEEKLKIFITASEGKSDMQQLLQSIISKEIHTQVENINIPGKPFRMYVRFKNTDTLWGRIIDGNQLKKLTANRGDAKYWEAIVKLPYKDTFIQALPQINDYQQHAVEIKIDALPPGSYAILASGGKDFSRDDKMILQNFDVSYIGYINNAADYFVLNRETGHPYKEIKVSYGIQQWDNKKAGYAVKEFRKVQPDEHGYFKLLNNENQNQRNVILKFSTGNDSLQVQSNNYYIPYQNFNETEKDTSDETLKNSLISFFTDRSIYRPGQTVFFKGLGITKKEITAKPLAYKDSITVLLNDVNGKPVDSVNVSFNSYGSISGKLIIPENVLTGEFTITTNVFPGTATISVEEYKRPKFYVSFDTLKTAYRLNDTIRITGYAKAYAGNSLNNAVVKFNVQRNTRFLYPWMFWRMIRPASAPKQIAEGTLQTDADGRFEIEFVALPDASVDPETDPVFDFSIDAAVTDINGETRAENMVLSVGYKSLQLEINAPAVAAVNRADSITISAKNLSGQDIPANVSIKIYSLQIPDNLYRKRYWPAPDLFVLTKEQFHDYFPYDEYKNETDFHSWPVKDSVLKDLINTNEEDVVNIQSLSLKEGWYKIEASAKDKDGREVRNIQYMQLYNEQSEDLPSLQANWNVVIKNEVQTGEEAKLLIGTDEDSLFLIKNVNHSTQTASENKYEYLDLNNEKKLLTYTTQEDDRQQGTGLYYSFVKHNRFYTGGMNISIVQPDKNLQISYASFRDKTEPRSKETWTVKISGNNNEKAHAELLTSMYDASLDQFKPHEWNKPNLWQQQATMNTWNGNVCFVPESAEENWLQGKYDHFNKQYDELATTGEELWYKGDDEVVVAGYGSSSNVIRLRGTTSGIVAQDSELKEVIIADSVQNKPEENREKNIPEIESCLQIRKNFLETAFFYPQLYADSAGNYSFTFTMPDALTRWKWMSFAHTKDLAFGIHAQTVITQKTLMIQPGIPRFLREGDKMFLSFKISNTSEINLSGETTLQLINATTGKAADNLFHNDSTGKSFTVEAGKSINVNFPILVPENFTAPLTWRIIAKAGNYSDGEENTLPVLSNRILVTETLPLYMRSNGTKQFTFEKLLNDKSETLTNESLSIEYTPNPVWYAIQSLPYLIEYPHDCAEQIFNRFYANALAAYIVSQHPRIKAVFEKWKTDSSALQSNLVKNQELKQILIEETPWVLDAENETQQKKNIAMLFDAVIMSEGMQTALQQLSQAQMDNGAFPWFKGGLADRYITQYILAGIGRLQSLNAINSESKKTLEVILQKGLAYADNQIKKDYNNLLNNKADLKNDQLNPEQIQYLYIRSYFSEIPVAEKNVYNYYYKQSMNFWNKQNEYLKAMIATFLVKTNEQDFAIKNIIPSILENAVVDSLKGMYWKNSTAGYYWYQSPVEKQALMIELINQIAHQRNDATLKADVDNMRTWLLLNKQTNNWKTTKATADACYALLMNNDAQLNDKSIRIVLGDSVIHTTNTEAGTGYIKQTFKGTDVKPAMGEISVSVQSQHENKSSSSASWGGAYWQYFENMDKITSAASPLSLSKAIFKETNTDKGKILEPVHNGARLKVGDKAVIRIVLKTDRDMEYIHLKDMRAAAMEPLNVLSGYKWQDGLGYYENTKDASTNFFISNLPKGTYVFEYPVYITHKGSFSAGIATVQCMYAPEFSSHSEGLSIKVSE